MVISLRDALSTLQVVYCSEAQSVRCTVPAIVGPNHCRYGFPLRADLHRRSSFEKQRWHFFSSCCSTGSGGMLSADAVSCDAGAAAFSSRPRNLQHLSGARSCQLNVLNAAWTASCACMQQAWILHAACVTCDCMSRA